MREMKESGIEWVGDVPAEWRVCRGKDVLAQLSRQTKDDDGIVTCFRDGEVTLRSNRREDGFTVAEKEFGYQGIEPGDLVVHGMDGFAGSIGVSDSRGKGSPVLNVLDSDEDKRFLMYCLRGLAYRDVYMAMATGIRVRSCNLNWKKLSELPLAIPERSEQLNISSFLDQKCAEINKAIEAAEESIEEYKLYKKSVIFQAVTKGLDPNVPMKDSGIEWVGSIPASWTTTRIKNLLAEKSVKGRPDETVLSLYREYGIIPKDSRDDNHNVTSSDTSSYKFIEVGDFVINKMKAWQGSMALSGYQGIISPAYLVYQFILEDVDPKYLHHLLRSRPYADEFARLSTGIRIGQWDLHSNDFLCTLALLPPLGEQTRIVAYVDDRCSEIDKAIEAKQLIIDELKAYKKSLIWEAVTGKREVV